MARLPSDPAVYLAHRFREVYDLEYPADAAEIDRAAAARGARVAVAPGLPQPGAFCGDADRELALILVRPDAPAWIHGHEAAHFVFWDNARYGVDLPLADPEHAADRFAAALCEERAALARECAEIGRRILGR